MALQIIHVGILAATCIAAVSLVIRVGVWLARRFRPGLDPKATEGVVLRFLGSTSGYACLPLVLAHAIMTGKEPSEGMIGFLMVSGIVGLALILGWFVDFLRDRPKS